VKERRKDGKKDEKGEKGEKDEKDEKEGSNHLGEKVAAFGTVAVHGDLFQCSKQNTRKSFKSRTETRPQKASH
jgi:hypothetical protein